MKKSWMKKIAFTVGALALSLGVVGLKASAAETGSTTEPTSGVYITKTLITPDTDVTTIPDMTFEFALVPETYYPYNAEGKMGTGVAANTMGDKFPGITEKNIQFTHDEMATDTTSTDGTATLTKYSSDLLAGVTYSQVGVYDYKVVENTAVDPAIDPTTGGAVTYDTTTYTLRVWVENDGNGGFTVTATLVDANGAKLAEGVNGFAFTNKYTIKNTDPVDPTNPESSDFWVKKLVAGEAADINKDFNYTLTIPENELTKDQTYTLKFADPTATEITVTPGIPVTYTLKHNQYAYIESITAGAQVTVTETDDADYNEANEAIFNGIAATGTLAATGTIGSAANNVTYTNTHLGAEVTPTGILMNNLPYVALIVIGGLGLGFYVMNKRRNA